MGMNKIETIKTMKSTSRVAFTYNTKPKYMIEPISSYWITRKISRGHKLAKTGIANSAILSIGDLSLPLLVKVSYLALLC